MPRVLERVRDTMIKELLNSQRPILRLLLIDGD
jgi:hypothetical protein